MKQTISRTITETHVFYATVKIVGTEPELEQATTVLFGKYDSSQVSKMLNKNSKNAISVLEVEHKTKTYEMELEDFINNATIKEEK